MCIYWESCSTPISDDHEEKYGVPSLEELGMDIRKVHAAVWHGGEKEALVRLNRHLERKVCIYGNSVLPVTLKVTISEAKEKFLQW